MKTRSGFRTAPFARLIVSIALASTVFVAGSTDSVRAQTPPTRPVPSLAPQTTRASDKLLPVIQAASDAEQRASQLFGDSFAGIYLEVTGTPDRPRQGDNAHVLLKDLNTAGVAQIRQGVRFPERLVFEKARFSRKELRTLQARIASDQVALAARNVEVAAVGERTDLNQLQVDVVSTATATTTSATAVLMQLYGGDAIRVNPIPARIRASDRYSDGWPLKAGYYLNDTQVACTEGFMAYNSTGWKVLTAAHCFQGGASIYHGSGIIGQVQDRRRGNGRLDVESIGITGYVGQISRTVIRAYPREALVEAIETQQFMNKVVCKSGITTDETCSVVNMVHLTATISDAGGTYSVQDMVRSHAPTRQTAGGDSGGPVYTTIGDSTQVSAEGITSAEGDDGRDLYYSFAGNILPDMGLQILIT